MGDGRTSRTDPRCRSDEFITRSFRLPPGLLPGLNSSPLPLLSEREDNAIADVLPPALQRDERYARTPTRQNHGGLVKMDGLKTPPATSIRLGCAPPDMPPSSPTKTSPPIPEKHRDARNVTTPPRSMPATNYVVKRTDHSHAFNNSVGERFAHTIPTAISSGPTPPPPYITILNPMSVDTKPIMAINYLPSPPCTLRIVPN